MGLKGRLADLPLADLIEMTSLGGKTGRLTVFSEGGAEYGRLAFRDGRLVGAVCGDLSVEQAFYALLALKDGDFDFDAAAERDDESCDLPTEALLMEGMRRLDELDRLRHALPAPARVRLLGGEAQDEREARVLGYLGPGARRLGDLVAGLLVHGDADECEALSTVQRLAARGVVRVETPQGLFEADQGDPSRAPQPELER